MWTSLLTLTTYRKRVGNLICLSWKFTLGTLQQTPVLRCKGSGQVLDSLVELGMGFSKIFLKEEFKKEGVDISQLQTDEGANSGFRSILVTPDGERTMFCNRGANTRLDPEKIDQDYVKKADILHVSGYIHPTTTPRCRTPDNWSSRGRGPSNITGSRLNES